MTNRVTAAGAVLIAGWMAAAPAAQQGGSAARPVTRETFAGVWRLVSFENIDEKGTRTPAGYDQGRIRYDVHGNMAAQLMRSTRQPHAATPPTDAERSASYGSYVAYYGRYDLDPATSKVTHHVAGALNPNWVNTDLIRYWAFSPDGRLSLSVRNAAGRTTGTLVWERIQ